MLNVFNSLPGLVPSPGREFSSMHELDGDGASALRRAPASDRESAHKRNNRAPIPLQRNTIQVHY